jgi:hypothetical protein
MHDVADFAGHSSIDNAKSKGIVGCIFFYGRFFNFVLTFYFGSDVASVFLSFLVFLDRWHFGGKGNLDGRLEYSFKNDGIIEVCRLKKYDCLYPFKSTFQGLPRARHGRWPVQGPSFRRSSQPSARPGSLSTAGPNSSKPCQWTEQQGEPDLVAALVGKEEREDEVEMTAPGNFADSRRTRSWDITR